MAPKLVCEHSYSSTGFRCTLPKTSRTQLIVVQYCQRWDEEANRVDGWDREAANRRTEVFRAKDHEQTDYFYAGLADESLEPQIEALGRYLKSQKLLGWETQMSMG